MLFKVGVKTSVPNPPQKQNQKHQQQQKNTFPLRIAYKLIAKTFSWNGFKNVVVRPILLSMRQVYLELVNRRQRMK